MERRGKGYSGDPREGKGYGRRKGGKGTGGIVAMGGGQRESGVGRLGKLRDRGGGYKKGGGEKGGGWV